MKLLTFTTLFPHAAKPSQGIFVETRLRHLLAGGEVQAKVVAPIPWFPSTHERFGKYATFAKAPKQEKRFGIDVLHPRYPVLPKIGMTMSPFLLAAWAKPAIRRLLDEGYDFDLIDAHYFYPDGVAAVMLGKHFGKPVVITARGSDISLIPQHRLPKKMIMWAAREASGLITVCNALKNEMVQLGVDADRIVSLRNGVDLELFQPLDRVAARKSLNLGDGITLLSVGNLAPVKGHDLTITALSMLPDVQLLIAGSGPELGRLQELANKLNVAERVTFLGSVAQADLKTYYSAADAMVLSSSREGWANVLLESMACGTPVIASKVWGTPEVVAAPEAGVLMKERSPQGIADACRALFTDYPQRAATRRYAEKFSWDATSAGQLQLFRQILKTREVAAYA
jgi:glycosyltransferase involved in cell wall biosynthesis